MEVTYSTSSVQNTFYVVLAHEHRTIRSRAYFAIYGSNINTLISLLVIYLVPPASRSAHEQVVTIVETS